MLVELSLPQIEDVLVDPAKMAVVVIDLENEFCAPGGGIFLGKDAEEAVLASAALIARAVRAVPPSSGCVVSDTVTP